ncbi:hypothetical protein M422DRAFT_270948 [Sphaerobolus stellatus SS14]|uniref:DNA endonuclease activator Ctp1 C-terminal domain-containing protein n=1 Tax=Sphaerobolus stellatus (strain SS14) TaxID=990650 RepID=A0A0C9UFU4_SPHS4|nr:hypothetical protein M422DRAFT_270948 [Sphaerobolus stellatus SS14]
MVSVLDEGAAMHAKHEAERMPPPDTPIPSATTTEVDSTSKPRSTVRASSTVVGDQEEALPEPPLTEEESFTQPCSTMSGGSPSRVLSTSVRQEDPAKSPPSQDSVTEPASSFSVINASKSSSQCFVLVVDSSPEKGSKPVGNTTESDDDTDTPDTPSFKRKAASQLGFNGNINPKTPHDNLGETGSSHPRAKARGAAHPVTEPPPQKSFLTQTPTHHRLTRRTVSSVLAPDTPPKYNIGVRHSSSPPESPHMRRLVSKGKRKVAEMVPYDAEGEEESDGSPKAGPSKGKGKAATSVQKSASKKEGFKDYMKYKGKGRYSNAHAADTINAEFEIDPEKNRGVKFQYDAVVRDKNERKQLEAGDCECCRDYYEAVGPVPPRLQAPLWRSPSSSQQNRPCRYKQVNDDDPFTSSATKAHGKEIEAHKREISRHRHNWAPTNTPPDFWKIGFPDTQEVQEINQRAADMHARKFRRVEEDAE